MKYTKHGWANMFISMKEDKKWSFTVKYRHPVAICCRPESKESSVIGSWILNDAENNNYHNVQCAMCAKYEEILGLLIDDTRYLYQNMSLHMLMARDFYDLFSVIGMLRAINWTVVIFFENALINKQIIKKINNEFITVNIIIIVLRFRNSLQINVPFASAFIQDTTSLDCTQYSRN